MYLQDTHIFSLLPNVLSELFTKKPIRKPQSELKLGCDTKIQAKNDLPMRVFNINSTQPAVRRSHLHRFNPY